MADRDVPTREAAHARLVTVEEQLKHVANATEGHDFYVRRGYEVRRAVLLEKSNELLAPPTFRQRLLLQTLPELPSTIQDLRGRQTALKTGRANAAEQSQVVQQLQVVEARKRLLLGDQDAPTSQAAQARLAAVEAQLRTVADATEGQEFYVRRGFEIRRELLEKRKRELSQGSGKEQHSTQSKSEDVQLQAAAALLDRLLESAKQDLPQPPTERQNLSNREREQARKKHDAALELLNKGQAKEALSLFEQAVTAYKDVLSISGPEASPWSAFDLGNIYMELHQPAEARQYFELARQYLPNSPWPDVGARRALIELRQLKHAEKAFHTAQGKVADHKQAGEYLHQIERLREEAKRAHAEGQALVKGGEREKAIAQYTRALQTVGPEETPWSAFDLGNIYLDLHKPEDALQNFEVARRYLPNSPWPDVGLGRTLIELNRLDEAEQALRLAQQKVPNHKQAGEYLKRIEQLREEAKQRKEVERIRLSVADMITIPSPEMHPTSMMRQVDFTSSPMGHGDTMNFRAVALPRGESMLGSEYNNIKSYLNYFLPPGTDASQLAPPSDFYPYAPVKFSYNRVSHTDEFVLYQSTYQGRDAYQRNANYYTHLLKGKTMPGFGREAIHLWGANFWRAYNLSGVSGLRGQEEHEFLKYPAQVNEDVDLAQVTAPENETTQFNKSVLETHLATVVEQYLLLEKGQKLCIQGKDANVAALITGVAACIPPELLQESPTTDEFTFSTYEEPKNILGGHIGQYTELPKIVGTCYLEHSIDSTVPDGLLLNGYIFQDEYGKINNLNNRPNAQIRVVDTYENERSAGQKKKPDDPPPTARNSAIKDFAEDVSQLLLTGKFDEIPQLQRSFLQKLQKYPLDEPQSNKAEGKQKKWGFFRR